jgi:DWNN domain
VLQNSSVLRSSDFKYDTISFSDTHPDHDSPFTSHPEIMTSSVFYRFKSQKEPTRLEFDGTGISVFELKRDIIIKSGLGDGTDFDLAVFSDDGKEGKFSLL